MINRRTAIAAGLALGAAPTLATPARKPFPRGFLWGTATAGHQVEGNNTNSDIWLLEHVKPTSFVEPSGDAANSFALWRSDLALVKAMGLNAYRFSIEWARIEPERGEYSVAMLDHYKAIIAGCHARGIAPIVSFNHFTTPRWFAAMGGWHHADAASLFARYCDRAARALADGISHATTLNEPNLAGLLGEVLPGPLMDTDRASMEAAAKALGVPRFTSGSALYIADPAIFRTHQIAGHKAGRAAIKAVRGDLPVGVTLAILDEQAAGDTMLRDRMRERFYGEWLRAAKGDDFIGVQNYERRVWGTTAQIPAPADARRNSSGAEVWAGSLAGAVRYAHQATGLPVMVTEHGVGTDDDALRAWLIPNALSDLKAAMDEGIPVKGYIHWSLVDNFEWVFGYKVHFGLHSLDRTTFGRTPKPSASVLAAIARRNAL